MNVVVADGAVAVLKDDNIGVLAGVFPMNVLGEENVLVLPVFDPLNGAGGIMNDTDAGCGGCGGTETLLLLRNAVLNGCGCIGC